MTEVRHNGGFTIIELMVTVMVVAILAAIGLPAVSTFIKNDRSWTQANTLVITLNYARSEAVKRDLATGVSVCTTTDNLVCTPNPWQNGWIVRVNDPVNPLVLQVVNALAGPNTLSEASGITELQFQPNGTVVFVGNPGVATASFKVCDQSMNPQYARDVEVGIGGRVVSSTQAGVSVAGVAMACP